MHDVSGMPEAGRAGDGHWPAVTELHKQSSCLGLSEFGGNHLVDAGKKPGKPLPVF